MPANPQDDVVPVPVPMFTDNYAWVLSRGRHAVVVDPGDADAVRAHLDAHALQLDAILVTHHHADHQGGVRELSRESSCEVFGPADTVPGVTRDVRDATHITTPSTGMRFSVMRVPGHTLDHVAYAGHGSVFCGDTLFGAGCGRLFEGTPAQMLASLRTLRDLPAGTRVCCAHEYTLQNLRFAHAVEPGNTDILQRMRDVEALRAAGHPSLPSTLEEERRTNPFLRWDMPGVRAAARERVPGAADDVDVFAAIRAWKDVF